MRSQSRSQSQGESLEQLNLIPSDFPMVLTFSFSQKEVTLVFTHHFDLVPLITPFEQSWYITTYHDYVRASLALSALDLLLSSSPPPFPNPDVREASP